MSTVFGGNSEEVTPVPIPNTEVKLFSADGTAREAEWESRTSPNFFKTRVLIFRPRVFLWNGAFRFPLYRFQEYPD